MTAVATVKGGFWPEQGIVSYTQVQGTSSMRRFASQALSKKGTMALRELMETLNGAAPGAAASKALARIAAVSPSGEYGGNRVIQTETLVSRNTTAGDETTIDADILSLSTKTYDPTPVANRNRNPLGMPGLF